ncbi:MAG: LpxD N-terminal domain-containing protein [Flavobacteriales bacterium]
MKFDSPKTIKELSELLGCAFSGNPELLLYGLNEIHVAEEGDIVFVDNSKYFNKVLGSTASCILINEKVDHNDNKGLLISEDPFRDFNKLIQYHSPEKFWNNDSEQAIGKDTVIHPSAVLGDNIKIGNNCRIHPGVVIGDRTVIGDNVVIRENSVIGTPAFYYKNRRTHYERLKSCGNTEISDNVEIGALCSVDQGVTGTTKIDKGTKIDNQVQIGHDTIIGQHCILAAHVGIAGCVHIKNKVTLWGQVGVISDVIIGEEAEVYGQAGISKDLKGGKSYIGSPAEEAKMKFKEMAAIRKLPEFFKSSRKS